MLLLIRRTRALGFRLAGGALCFLAALLVTQPVAGQATQAAIIGTVTDTSGAVLPGVTVTATGAGLAAPRDAVTNERGEYRLSALPQGVFTLSFDLPGFQPVKREGVRLPVGFTATIDQVLGLGSVEETITVSGQSPLVDVTNPSTSVDLSSEGLEILPTTRDGLKAFMAQVPGMRTNLDVGASSMTDTITIRAYGQSGAPWQMLEGIMFASSGGSGVQGAHVDFNAIESTRLQTVGSSAEMPRRGPFIDSVAKSGSNQFHGEAVAYGSSDSLEGSNLNDSLRAAGVRGVPKLHGMWDYSGAFGGRIIPNKLWFFVSGRAEGYDREILNAFREDGSPILVETDQAFHAEKLTWQVSQQNKVTLFYHGALDLQIRGASQFRPAESMEIHRGPVSMYKGEFQTVRGNSMVASIQYGNWYKHAYYFALPGYRGEGHKVSTVDTVTQFVTGDHLSDQRVEDYFRNHTKGSISFYGADFIRGSHQLKAGFDHLFGGYPHKQGSMPAGNYQLRFQNGVPAEIDTFNYPVRPYNDNHYLGVYLQDAWTFSPRLNLSLGARYAYDNAYAPAQCQEPGQFAAPKCYDKLQARIWHSVVPRAHFALDLMGNGKSVLKGGYGMFVNLREVNPEIVAANRNNRQTTRWRWRDLNGNRNYDPGEVNLDPNGPDFLSISGVTNAILNPNEPQPKSDEWSLTFERELRGNWGIRSTFVYARNYNLRGTEEYLRPFSMYNIAVTNPDPGADGAVGTSDDPNRTITYYEYPASVSGIDFAGTTLVGVPYDQKYTTVEVAGTRRMANQWQMNTSLSFTKTDNPFDDRQNLNPNTLINTDQEYWEYTAKASGGYVFPFDLVASVNFERRRGLPQSRQHQFGGGATIRTIVLNTDPLGTIRLPSTNLVDFRFAKRIRIRGSSTLEGRFDFFNVFNANFVTGRNLRSGSNYLVPNNIILPRILQVGATYNF
jgi:hypothetical protein